MSESTHSRHRDGLIFFVLGAIVFVFLGLAMEQQLPNSLGDFKALYFPAKCLLQHCDPYDMSSVARIADGYLTDHERHDSKAKRVVAQFLYPPTAFALSLPFALLPLPIAEWLWLGTIASLTLYASVLIWKLSAPYAPVLAGAVLGFMLANSEVLLITGVCAAIAIPLCIIAVWSLTQERLPVLGVVCLALSLAVKPWDTGLVWLYFLLAGGVLRKRALQTLGALALVSIPILLWMSSASPHWWTELSANVAAGFVRGGTNDPGPASRGGHGLAMVVSLQTVFSMVRDDPRFYNLASLLVALPVFVVWMVRTIKVQATQYTIWIALAAGAGLSMLPVYHRQYDAKLLFLTIPACAILWARGGNPGRSAVLVNLTAIVLNGDLTQAMILGFVGHLPVRTGGLGEQFMAWLQVFPTPLSLLASSIAFLWLYVRGTGPAGSAQMKAVVEGDQH